MKGQYETWQGSNGKWYAAVGPVAPEHLWEIMKADQQKMQADGYDTEGEALAGALVVVLPPG